MRSVVAELEESRIREVANAGMGRDDMLAFWFGESDEVTPGFIREAAIASLNAGETFYAHNLGLPALREALGRYTHKLHPQHDAAHWQGRIAVTSGGVNGLMLAAQTLVDAGDEVVVVTPVWPNLVAQPLIMGGKVRCISLHPGDDGLWRLDLAELLAAVTPGTRMLVLNAPNNPTGWTLTRAEQQAILDHCRRTGTWVLADEVYERLYYAESGNGCAPSFLDVAEPDDRLIVVHSFSKSFLMTGWRLGWMVLPESLVPAVEKLAQNLFICPSHASQIAALGALTPEGEAEVAGHIAAYAQNRARLMDALPGMGFTDISPADGAFYIYAGVSRLSNDSRTFCARLLERGGVAATPAAAASRAGS
jgi:aspartate/methionine/tyrosine aminotransferase